MGQAKLRGTFEERKAAAIARNKECTSRLCREMAVLGKEVEEQTLAVRELGVALTTAKMMSHEYTFRRTRHSRG